MVPAMELIAVSIPFEVVTRKVLNSPLPSQTRETYSCLQNNVLRKITQRLSE